MHSNGAFKAVENDNNAEVVHKVSPVMLVQLNIDQTGYEEDILETQKLNEIWTYFEQKGNKARCVVCRESLADLDYEHLKAHLFENHPKLLLQLVHDQEEKQETKSNDSGDVEDNDNTYTEVIYLEQDSSPEDSQPQLTANRSKITNTYAQKRANKRTRDNSIDHPIIQLKKEKNDPRTEQIQEEENELEVFIKYIRCLLKKLTPDAFSKVQVEILKTIMSAQYSNVAVIDNNSGTSILSDIANGAVANVIRVNDIPDNSSVLANYTVTLASKGDDLEGSKGD